MDPIDYAGGIRGFAIEEGVNGFFSIIAGISDFELGIWGCSTGSAVADRLMTLTIEIPDHLASCWPEGGDGMARTVLEDFAVESYRQGRLSAFQVRQLLGHESRWETEEFLSSHDAWPDLTVQEMLADGRALNALLGR